MKAARVTRDIREYVEMLDRRGDLVRMTHFTPEAVRT
jgi:hypothetical protein